MKNESKNSKFVIIILAILLLLSLGYIGYKELLKKDVVKQEKEDEPTTKKTNDISRNSYEIFSTNIKNKIKACNLRTFLAMDGQYANISYKVILTNKMELIVLFPDAENEKKYGEIKIADKVINFNIAQTGPGAYQNIYFINEDGTVGEAIPWELFDEEKKEQKITVNNPISGLKEIVSIVQASYQDGGYMQEPAFIDINGNIFENAIASYWD